MFGIFGPILVNTGVLGDLREDCEDADAFSKELPEVEDPDLGFCLREKRPMMKREGGVGWRGEGLECGRMRAQLLERMDWLIVTPYAVRK